MYAMYVDCMLLTRHNCKKDQKLQHSLAVHRKQCMNIMHEELSLTL